MKKFSEVTRKYINASSKNEVLKYENILFAYLLIPVYIFFALYSLSFYLFFEYDLVKSLVNSFVFLANIAIMLIVQLFINSEKLKSNIIIFLLTAFVAFFVIRYYELLFNVVWLVVAIFLMVAIGKNDNKLLIFMILDISVLTIYIVLRYPEHNVAPIVIAQSLAFMGLITVTAILKRIHKKRVNMIDSQLNQSEIIAKISSELVTVNQDNFKTKLNNFLSDIGPLYNMDRISVWKISSDMRHAIREAEWAAPGIDRIINLISEVEMDPWLREQIESKKIVVISNTEELNSNESYSIPVIKALNIKSIVSIPIMTNNIMYGFLIIHSIKAHGNWRSDEKRHMTILTNMLGDAYYKLEKENELLNLVRYDLLTGLLNRYSINNYLNEAIYESSNLAVLFIDLDSFKSINDTLGQEDGDFLLKKIAENLKYNLKSNEVIGRFGGDEFIIVIKNYVGLKELKKRINTILEKFNSPIVINDQKFYITASAGVSLFPADGSNSEILIKNANLAINEAKSLGRNKFKFWDKKMNEATEKKEHLKNLLNLALEYDEFILHYQPQIDIKTKKIIGVEALLRWLNPKIGMISPGVFIPLAEQSGLINSIGEWVLETALAQNKKWQDMGLTPIKMAVNLSVEQFRNPDLAVIVDNTIKLSGLEPKYVELEVTESIATKEVHNMVATLENFKALGVSVSIDDFGKEYSSLTRIKDLPIDRIKLAMEFVHGITVSKKDEAVLSSIITLGKNLGLKVIAEGVENETQLAFLNDQQCDEIQGFYFYKPMSADDVEKVLRKQTETDN